MHNSGNRTVAHALLAALVSRAPLTRSMVARAVGVTPQAVGAWLRHGSVPGRAVRHRLEDLYGIKVGDWDTLVRDEGADQEKAS